MTCNTSEVAVCRSFASFSSWVRVTTCFCRSATDGAAVGTLRALGLFACRPLTGCSLPPRCRISPPSGGHDEAQAYPNPGVCAMASVALSLWGRSRSLRHELTVLGGLAEFERE